MAILRRFSINDGEWRVLQGLLPTKRHKCGRKPRDHRLMVNACLWVACTGAPWRDLPSRFGPWQTAYDRYNRWLKDGTWKKIIELIDGNQAHTQEK